MAEYTYKDIIIDPTKEGIESLIGKEVYFHYNPFLCLGWANENSANNLGILVEITHDSNPFVIEGKSGDLCSYTCIIPKKEEPKPQYIPFENQEEFLNHYTWRKDSFVESSTVHQLSSLGGVWLKSKHLSTLYMVTEIWDRGVTIGYIKLRTTGNEDHDDYFTTNDVTKWHELYENYTFPDGTPCGKLKRPATYDVIAACDVEDSGAKTAKTSTSNASV